MLRVLTLAVLALGPTLVHAQTSSVLGIWREPQGSMLSIHPCYPADASQVCASIFHIRPGAPSTVDIHNPDPALRARSFCNLQIGSGFHLEDPAHAENGHLYDPRSGKTYSGSMRAEGDTLHLRGYILIKLLGRTETWTRMPANTPGCTS